jgi:hypothetical protein
MNPLNATPADNLFSSMFAPGQITPDVERISYDEMVAAPYSGPYLAGLVGLLLMERPELDYRERGLRPSSYLLFKSYEAMTPSHTPLWSGHLLYAVESVVRNSPVDGITIGEIMGAEKVMEYHADNRFADRRDLLDAVIHALAVLTFTGEVYQTPGTDRVLWVRPRAERIDSAEMAKKVRARLKEEFPKAKFKVRTERYAGGSSIHVTVEKTGKHVPTVDQVHDIVGHFRGASFDGMTDMKNYHDLWMLPGNRFVYAETPCWSNTVARFRMTPAEFLAEFEASKPEPEAVLVSPGNDYIIVQGGY